MDDFWNDNDREVPNAEGELQDYQCEGKLQGADRMNLIFACFLVFPMYDS